MKGERSFKYNLFLFFGVLILLELLLRLTGIYKTYTERIMNEYITHYDQTYPTWYRTWGDIDSFTLDHGEFRYTYFLNRYGIRERELEVSATEDSSKIRVFFFGDSFAEGVGAAYDSTYPRAVERLMQSDGYDAEIYNLGMSGNDPFYNHMLLRDKFMKYKPSHVIFGVNDSDFDDYFMRGGFERFLGDGTVAGKPSPWFHHAYKRSHVVRLVVHFSGYDRALIKRKDIGRLNTEACERMMQSLDSTKILLEVANVRFLVMVHDTPKELCNQNREHRINLFSDQEADFNMVFLGPDFRNAVDQANCYDIAWRTDGHYNHTGYALLGELLYNSIEKSYPEFWRNAVSP